MHRQDGFHFLCFALIIGLPLVVRCQSTSDQVDCSRTGTWGGWQAWSECSSGVQSRFRDCDPLPDGCLASSPFVCLGNYTDQQSCTGSGSSSSSPASSTWSTVWPTSLWPTSSSSSSTPSTSSSTPLSTTRSTSTPLPLPLTSSSSSSSLLTTILTTISTTLSSSTTTTTPSTTTTTPSATTPSTTSMTPTPTLPNGNQLPVTTCNWGEWGAWSSCSDTCGMCGSQQRFRNCPTGSNCTCTGDAFEKVNCGSPVCLYPRATCCSGYTPASVNNIFSCINSTSGR